MEIICDEVSDIYYNYQTIGHILKFLIDNQLKIYFFIISTLNFRI